MACLLLLLWLVSFGRNPPCSRASLVAHMVKSLPILQETQVQSLVWEDPLEEEMATHSRILAWKIPWTEEPGRLQSRGLQRVEHSSVTTLHFTSLLVQECWEQIMQIILRFPIVVELLSHVQLLCDPMESARLLRPWDFPSKSTGVGCDFVFQGIFLTQESNPCFLYWSIPRRIFYYWATWEAVLLYLYIYF